MTKKLLVLTFIALFAAASLFAGNAFFGISGNFAANGSFNKNQGGFQKNDDITIATNLNPSLGTYLSKDMMVGVQTGFNYTHYEPGAKPNILNLVALVVGGDVSITDAANLYLNKTSYHTFSAAVAPYFRYRVLSGVKGFSKVGAWLEARLEYKQFFTFTDDAAYPSKAKLSARIHPLVTYDLTDDITLFTAADVFALKASCEIDHNRETDVYTTSWKAGLDGMFSMDTVTQAFLRIGVLKKFD